MEPDNHPLEKENTSSKSSFLGSMLVFRGLSSLVLSCFVILGSDLPPKKHCRWTKNIRLASWASLVVFIPSIYGWIFSYIQNGALLGWITLNHQSRHGLEELQKLQRCGSLETSSRGFKRGWGCDGCVRPHMFQFREAFNNEIYLDLIIYLIIDWVVVCNILLFSPLPREMIQFDQYFSSKLKPPTS